MKRYLLIAAMLSVVSSAANAQVTNVWAGNLFITSTEGTCSTINGGVGLGDHYHVQYKPSGLPGNATGDVMVLVSLRGAFSLRTSSGRMTGSGSSFQTAMSGGSVNVSGPGSNLSGVSPNATFTNVAFAPASFNESTQYLSMTGTFSNFFNIAGCTAVVSGAMVKRVLPTP